MPVYVYICNDCASKFEDADINSFDDNGVEEAVLFETFHAIQPSKEELDKAVVCPRCDSKDCKRWIHGTSITTYVRGFGWKDKAGAKRDMHVYHLDNQDPYSKHRVPGEAEHIRRQLKDGGKHQTNSKVFAPRKSTDSS